MPDGNISMGLLPSQLLTPPVPLSRLARAYSAIAPALRVHVGVGRVVWMTLRALRLLGPRIYSSVASSIPAWRHGFEVARIAASAMLALLASGAFLRVVTSVINHESFRNRPFSELVSHDVRLPRLSVEVEGAVPLVERTVPRPAVVRRTLVDEGSETSHRVAKYTIAPSSVRRPVTPHTQVMRVAEAGFLGVDRPVAAVHRARRLCHV